MTTMEEYIRKALDNAGYPAAAGWSLETAQAITEATLTGILAYLTKVEPHATRTIDSVRNTRSMVDDLDEEVFEP